MSRSVSAPSSVTKTSPCWNGLIVPGSTLMYGSNFWTWILSPRALRSAPSDAAVMPFPSDETTPPATKTYFTGRAVTCGLPERDAEGSGGRSKRPVPLAPCWSPRTSRVAARADCPKAPPARPSGDRTGPSGRRPLTPLRGMRSSVRERAAGRAPALATCAGSAGLGLTESAQDLAPAQHAFEFVPPLVLQELLDPRV